MRRNVLAALSAMLFMALMVAANPAQGQVTVNNNTICTISVCTAKGGCITIPPGTTVVPISCATAVRIGVCGQNVAIPPGGCLFNIPVGAGGCCADVCFNVVTCTIDINPTLGPCRCP